MPLIEFWESSIEPTAEVVLTSNAAADDLSSFLDEGLFPCVSYAYKLSKNAIGHENLIIDYLATRHLTPEEFEEYECKSDIIRVWNSLRKCLLNFDIEGYRALTIEFKKSKPSILRDSDRLISLLDDIAYNIIRPCINFSFYENVPSQDWIYPWWKNLPNAISGISKLSTRINAHPFPDAIVSPLKSKLGKILDYLNSINKSLTSDLLMISALCFCAARMNQKRSNFDLSIIFQHRALDFYLQYYCVSEKILTKTVKSELVYTTADLKDEKITIINSHNALISRGVIIASHEHTHFITRLNNTRNMLIQTHSVYNVSESDSAGFLEKLQSYIQMMDGSSTNWKNTVKDLNFYLMLPANSIFDIEDSFDSNVVKIYG